MLHDISRPDVVRAGRRYFLVTALAWLCLAIVWPRAASAAADTQMAPVSQPGTVGGAVTYTGARRSGSDAITRDPDVCGSGSVADGSVLVGEAGGLAGVVVSLEGVSAGKALPAGGAVEVVIQQCRMTPRVSTLTLGGKLTLRNADGLLHRPRASIGPVPIFQWAMPLPQRLPTKIRHTGRMEVRCAVHGWARAWVSVFPHPYHTVTDGAGAYRIHNVPPGAYTLTFWHERLGEEQRGIVVDSHAGAAMDFSYP